MTAKSKILPVTQLTVGADDEPVESLTIGDSTDRRIGGIGGAPIGRRFVVDVSFSRSKSATNCRTAAGVVIVDGSSVPLCGVDGGLVNCCKRRSTRLGANR
jgi:hypothetical protein